MNIDLRLLAVFVGIQILAERATIQPMWSTGLKTLAGGTRLVDAPRGELLPGIC